MHACMHSYTYLRIHAYMHILAKQKQPGAVNKRAWPNKVESKVL